MNNATGYKYVNHYKCHCGAAWSDGWDCACNDRCPKCNKEIEPYRSDSDDSEPPIKLPVSMSRTGDRLYLLAADAELVFSSVDITKVEMEYIVESLNMREEV